MDFLDRLIRELSLATLAFGIAGGWALFQVAQGVADTVATLLSEPPEGAHSFVGSQPLTWFVGDRILTLNALLRGLIELAVVLAAAAFVTRRQHGRRLNARHQA
jgi:hypothetical protein